RGHEGLLRRDHAPLDPGAEVGQHGEAVIEAPGGPLGAVLGEHLERWIERAELLPAGPDPERAQAERLAQRARRFILAYSVAEAGDEAPRLRGGVDGRVAAE